MGRPDLSDVRRDEILDALERCVAREGLAGASLDKIADEAGMKRQIIRHYLGNRDEVIRAFGRRLIGRMHRDVELMVGALPRDGRVDTLIGLLFAGSAADSGDSPASVLLLEALIAAAEREPEFRDLVGGYVEALTRAIDTELRAAHPDAEPSETFDVAYAIVGLCFNHESLRPLRLSAPYQEASARAARRLVGSLPG